MSDIPPIRDLAYVAGVLEADGCFSMKHGTPTIAVGMSDEDVVRRLQEKTGLGRVNGPYLNQAGHNVKPLWHWNVDRQVEAYALMVAVFQFMGARRQERITELVQDWLQRPAAKKFRTVCHEGHLLSGDNLYVYGRSRYCKTCRTARSRDLRARRKAAV